MASNPVEVEGDVDKPKPRDDIVGIPGWILRMVPIAEELESEEESFALKSTLEARRLLCEGVSTCHDADSS